MCYNTPISFVFSAVGLVTFLYIQWYVPILRVTGIQYILGFYALMELLQGVQYYVVNQCSNLINVASTELAYVLVLVQPLMWNTYFYANSIVPGESALFLCAQWLCAGWIAVNAAARALYTKNSTGSMFGPPQTQRNSVYASDRVCTKRKLTHLYWEWTSANFMDLNANMLMYLMVWFVPALISTQFRAVSGLLVLSALLGAFMAYRSGEFFTYTSLWCYISVPIVLAVILYIYMCEL